MKKIVIDLFVVLYCSVSLASSHPFMDDLTAKYRQEAAQAQAETDLLRTRNAWYKYAALQRLNPYCSRTENERLQTGLTELRGMLWPPSAQVETKIAPPVEKKEPREEVRRPPKLSAEELVKKAAIMQKNGQLTEALRFYRLAQEAEPAAEIEEKIRRLEEEMN